MDLVPKLDDNIFLMCHDCEFHRNERRDASIHAVVDTTLELGGKGKKGKKVEKTSLVTVKSEEIPDDFPFLQMAMRAKESGVLQGSDN